MLESILPLDDDIFFSPLHKSIFIKFKELIAQGYAPDAIAIDYFVKDKDISVLADGSFIDFLNDDIFSLEPTAYAAPVHIKILKDLHKRRVLLTQLKEVDSSYISTRNEIISSLLDTSCEIQEERINLFLERNK